MTMVQLPLMHGSDDIDASAPALHGCRSCFIFLLFITEMNLYHGDGSSASRDTVMISIISSSQMDGMEAVLYIINKTLSSVNYYSESVSHR